MELQYLAAEAPWSGSGGRAAPAAGVAPGVAAAHLSGTVVDAQYCIVPDAAVVRLTARRRVRRKPDSADSPDRIIFEIRNTCTAPLDLAVADLRVFDLGLRSPRASRETADAVADGASARTDVADVAKVSKTMTDAERALLKQCAASTRVDGACPFQVRPEPERVTTVAAGAQMSFSVRFVPPIFARQYIATFELRLGNGSTAKGIRTFTCFGNSSPELVQKNKPPDVQH